MKNHRKVHLPTTLTLQATVGRAEVTFHWLRGRTDHHSIPRKKSRGKKDIIYHKNGTDLSKQLSTILETVIVPANFQND